MSICPFHLAIPVNTLEEARGFYVDLLGSVEEEKVDNALNHLREITDFLEILGCYPRDEKHKKTD